MTKEQCDIRGDIWLFTLVVWMISSVHNMRYVQEFCWLEIIFGVILRTFICRLYISSHTQCLLTELVVAYAWGNAILNCWSGFIQLILQDITGGSLIKLSCWRSVIDHLETLSLLYMWLMLSILCVIAQVADGWIPVECSIHHWMWRFNACTLEKWGRKWWKVCFSWSKRWR